MWLKAWRVKQFINQENASLNVMLRRVLTARTFASTLQGLHLIDIFNNNNKGVL